MKCAFDECNKEANHSIGSGTSKGSLQMCNECFKLWQEHTDAREKMFYDEGVDDMKLETLKTLRIKNDSSRQQNVRKNTLGETSSLDCDSSPVVTENHISADSNRDKNEVRSDE